MHMAKQFKEKTFLTSKVARRIYKIFILSAILPLLIISAISFFFVGHQLQSEAEKRLRQLCKNKGLEIYERLLTMENELKVIARLVTLNRMADIDHQPYDALTREGSGLMRISLRFPDGRIQTIVDHADHISPFASRNLVASETSRTIIGYYQGDERYPLIRIARALDPQQPSKGLIVGEVDSFYIWGIGTIDALPPEIDMSVVQPAKRILISSIPDDKIDANFLESYRHTSVSGRYENVKSKVNYINCYWSLFLKHRFASPDWTVIFSQSKASILAPDLSHLRA